MIASMPDDDGSRPPAELARVDGLSARRSAEPGQRILIELSRRIKDGDQVAFGVFYDLTSALVFGIAVRVLRNRAHAEEVTQEVFVEVWTKAPTYRPERGSIEAWLRMITRRRAIDRVRSAEATRRRDHRFARAEGAEVSSVDTELMMAFEQDRIARAMTTLSKPQRVCIEMAFFEGHTYRDVALLLDMPEGTVKSRIRSGLRRLGHALREEDDSP